MAGAEVRHDSSERRGMALNAILGVASEAVAATAETLLLPSLLLAFFVAELTPSYPTIGLVPGVAIGFWTLARLPGRLITGPSSRKQPWSFAAAVVRAGAIGVLAVVTSRTSPAALSQSARPLLGTFFLCLIVYTLAGGFASVPHAILLGRSVSGQAWGMFVRQRAIWSALASVAGAFVAARLLGTNAVPFPGDYGLLFLAATVCLIAVAVVTVAIREPSAPPPAPPTGPRRSMWLPLHDGRYRRFLVFRSLLSATAVIDPFLFLYAVTRLGAPVDAIGRYCVLGVLGWVMTAPLWVWLERRAKSRSVLQAAAVIRLVAPAIALVVPQLAATAALRQRFPDQAPIVDLYGVAIFAIGAAMAAQSRANCAYLAGLAPAARLASYTGLTNSILAVVAFAPVLGGVLIERSGYEALFAVTVALGLAAVFASGWLDETVAARDQQDLRLGRGVRALPSGRI
jgi:hypothetical protein